MAACGAPSALSSLQLQAHYDEIQGQMPVLSILSIPRPLASTLATCSLEPAAARLAKKACSGIDECQVCSCTSQPADLQLLLSTKLDFHTRAVEVTAARFVCAQCAAVSNCNLLLQLLTPAAGGDSEEQDRVEQLHQLCLHFAAVNNAPASVTSSPDALALWLQELACRAYSLGVAVNSLKGWQLQPQGCSTLQILQQLLKHSNKKAGAQPDTTTGGKAAGTAGQTKGKKQKVSQQVEKQQQKQQQQHLQLQVQKPTLKQKTKAAGSKRGVTAAPAEALAAAEAAETPQAAPHNKKVKKSIAQNGMAAGSLGRPEQQTPETQQKQQQQVGGSSKKQRIASQQAGGAMTRIAAASKEGGVGVEVVAALRTPQHSKIKKSSKQKLLKSAPR